jgi:hypothetical protein
MTAERAVVLVLLWAASGALAAASLDVRFSCSSLREEGGDRVLYADHGEIRLSDSAIEVFQWESALHRSTHGFDCSIDEDDDLILETWIEADQTQWRISLRNARAARQRRGYDFVRSLACTIRLERSGELLHIRPTCPALCGSRGNFSTLAVNPKTGECRYEQ